MKFYIVFFLAIMALYSCSDRTKVIVAPENYSPLDSLSTAKTDIKLYALSNQAQKDLEHADDFQNLHKRVLSLSTSNPFQITKLTDSISEAIINFEGHLRPELKINSIQSRLVVLNTEIGILKNSIQKKYPDSEKILANAGRFITAYNSFIVQLNEFSLSIPESIKNELLSVPNKEDTN